MALSTSPHTVLHDPQGLIDADLPFDRAPYGLLVKTVLAWTSPHTLPSRDYEQIALLLTGHARAVAACVRRHANQLPEESGARALADIVLRDAEDRLSATMNGTALCAQNRARLVHALYERLDRIEAIRIPGAPQPPKGLTRADTT